MAADRLPVAQLNMTPGTKGLKKLLGTVPSWVTFQEKEKVEVRNLDHESSEPLGW